MNIGQFLNLRYEYRLDVPLRWFNGFYLGRNQCVIPLQSITVLKIILYLFRISKNDKSLIEIKTSSLYGLQNKSDRIHITYNIL